MAPRLNAALAVVAVVLIALSLWRLEGQTADLAIERFDVDGTPATLFRPAAAPAGPLVLIAHGFAGSQQLMQPLAIALARGGFTAVTFDYLGHGRNPHPLTGDVREPDGATLSLIRQMEAVAAESLRRARAAGAKASDYALLGHSMASDIVVRYAKTHEAVAAVVAVSMFSPEVEAARPPNLLIVVGEWEPRLLQEGRRALALAFPDADALERTYGAVADGSARRLVAADGVEHIGVLFSQEAMRESVAWLDQAFDGVAAGGLPPEQAAVNRGLWIVLLLLGAVLLARPLASRLPALGGEPLGANLTWRQFWPGAVGPAVLTPLLLAPAPTDFLPVLVGDYLALHFLVYGALTGAWLYWLRRRRLERQPVRPIPSVKLLAVALAASLYALLAVGAPADRYVTNFQLSDLRGSLMLAMVGGVLVFYLADEWLTRGGEAPRGAYWITKLLFLLSLGGAVALDPSELFFILILVPVIVPVFLIYGLLSRWTYLRTRHPVPGAIASALAVGWAIGVTFPVLSG